MCECVWGQDPEGCENGSTLQMKVAMSGVWDTGPDIFWLKVTHPLKPYPKAKATVLGFIL